MKTRGIAGVVLLIGMMVMVGAEEGRFMGEKEYRDGVVKRVERYVVGYPGGWKAPVSGDNRYYPGFGSGLVYRGKDEKGRYVFNSITDRGPNSSGPLTIEGHHKSLLMYDKDFTPYIAEIVVEGKKDAKAVGRTFLKFGGEMANGLPNDRYGNEGLEVAVDKHMNEVGTSSRGIDSEALAYDKGRKCYWVTDEYGPSICKVEEGSGNVVEQYWPGNGLPEELLHRQENAGFESIGVAPNGKVYFGVECTLDYDKKTKGKATFIRVVEFDPETKGSRMFAYPIEKGKYKRSNVVKLGDLLMLDDERMLIIEQGKLVDGEFSNVVYMADISEASDISGVKLRDGRALEYCEDLGELEKVVKVMKKREVLNPRKYGWGHRKMEGLALIDERRIGLVNDNDFGVQVYLDGREIDEFLDRSATFDVKGKEVYVEGKAVNKEFEFSWNKGNRDTELWIFELEDSVMKK